MQLSIIVALSRNLLIGTETGLPWHLPADLKQFRRITMGKPVILGRKTMETIGKPLPGRHMIVLTHNESYQYDGVIIAHKLSDALKAAQTHLSDENQEVMIIGGAEVYRRTLGIVNRMYLTVVEGQFEGTTHFPTHIPGEWRIVSTEGFPADEKNPHAFRFVTIEQRHREGWSELKKVLESIQSVPDPSPQETIQ